MTIGILDPLAVTVTIEPSWESPGCVYSRWLPYIVLPTMDVANRKIQFTDLRLMQHETSCI